MAVDHVKSTGITNADATPRVANTAGASAGVGALLNVTGYATALASSSADATYQLVRIPSAAKIKAMTFESEAQVAGKFDIGVYYATDGFANQPTALLAAAAINQSFFATVIDCASAVTRTDILNESTTNTLDKRDMPLWQALALATDPGGYFDIVATVKTTAVTTGTGKFGVSVSYVL